MSSPEHATDSQPVPEYQSLAQGLMEYLDSQPVLELGIYSVFPLEQPDLRTGLHYTIGAVEHIQAPPDYRPPEGKTVGSRAITVTDEPTGDTVEIHENGLEIRSVDGIDYYVWIKEYNEAGQESGMWRFNLRSAGTIDGKLMYWLDDGLELDRRDKWTTDKVLEVLAKLG